MRASQHAAKETQRLPMDWSRTSLAEWADRHAGRIMVLPAVLFILAFALFPLIVSAYLSVAVSPSRQAVSG